MNKLLLIPDIHARTFWKDAIQKYGDECNKIIILGDEVDPYPDEGYTRKDAIRTLEEVIAFKRNNNEKVVLLWGNHALHYLKKDFPRSSRYDSSHAYNIRELYSSNQHLFKLAHEEIINNKKYLFTHAGLMNSWVENNKEIIGEPTVENLNKLIETPNGIKALSQVSSYRSWLGEKSGSIVWSDVREKINHETISNDTITPNDDSIVDGYDYQIFGHTQMHEPIITDKWACIDCHRAFILEENENLIDTEKIKG